MNIFHSIMIYMHTKKNTESESESERMIKKKYVVFGGQINVFNISFHFDCEMLCYRLRITNCSTFHPECFPSHSIQIERKWWIHCEPLLLFMSYLCSPLRHNATLRAHSNPYLHYVYYCRMHFILILSCGASFFLYIYISVTILMNFIKNRTISFYSYSIYNNAINLLQQNEEEKKKKWTHTQVKRTHLIAINGWLLLSTHFWVVIVICISGKPAMKPFITWWFFLKAIASMLFIWSFIVMNFQH